MPVDDILTYILALTKAVKLPMIFSTGSLGSIEEETGNNWRLPVLVLVVT